MAERARTISIWDPKIVSGAIADSFRKLDPRLQIKNPVMFIVEVGSVLTTIIWFQELVNGTGSALFTGQVAFWLWFTVLFANFAEAMAEGRGKAQAATLRKAKTETTAVRVLPGGQRETVNASSLRAGDIVRVEAGQMIPGDGEIIEGVASVDESAITGESAPVIREAGGDRSAVTGGTKVLSDWIVVKITSNPGETFLDRMIALVEGAVRQKTPNEIALNILLAVLTLVFLLVVVTLRAVCELRRHVDSDSGADRAAGLPDPDDDRRADFGDRHRRHGPARPAERAGDVGSRRRSGRRRGHAAARQDRHDHAGQPSGDRVSACAGRQRCDAGRCRAARLAGRRDAGGSFDRRSRQGEVRTARTPARRARGDVRAVHRAHPHVGHRLQRPHDPQGRGRCHRAPRPASTATRCRPSCAARSIASAREGGTPLAVAENGRALGVIHLKDIVKGGIRDRFAHLRAMGIKTVMITGDNPLTAAAIAAEAGVDDFMAEATPEDKLKLIRSEQAGGRMVAMTGDGTNDAPALAQADVGVAMNTGTMAAKEAGNMVDLDSNPTKLIEIVEIGKQLLMTRGALTTFSIANDVAKYFAIIPAMFILAFPQLGVLNIMGLATPESAILSAVIFNAVIIIALIPLALRGITYKPLGAAAILRRNLLIYGVGGVLLPFIGIKAIDVVLVAVGLA